MPSLATGFVILTLLLGSLPAVSGCGLPGGGGTPVAGQPLETVDLRPPLQDAEARPPTAALPEGAAVDQLFGEVVIDRYRWLEDEKSERVQTWMAAHDRATRGELAKLPMRDALEKRFRELFYLDTRSLPVRRGDRLFFSRKPADKEKAIHLWQEGEAGTPRVLLDPNLMSTDGSLGVKGVTPSKDGRYVAYFESPNNADESTLRVLEVATGRLLVADDIAGLRYTGPSWTRDNRGFFYTWRPNDPAIPENERTAFAEVRFHELGTDPKKDRVVREKTGDASRWQGAWLSEDGEFLFLNVGRGWSQNDLFVKAFGKGGLDAPWQPVAQGIEATFDAFAYKGFAYVVTNHDAPHYALYRVDPNRLAREYWQLVLPERADAVLEGASILGGKLAARYLRNASSELELYELDGKKLRSIALPTIGTVSGFEGNEDQDVAYFDFSSFTRPTEIFKTSIKSGETKLFFKVSAPIDPERFVVRQEWYPGKDGTRISMFLVHAKDLVLEGKNPTLMYGYGGFNVSLTPHFHPNWYPWLEAGGVYAVPNLRGGGEYGEAWHQAGMLANKQNVFDDFIAAAEWLINQKYTDAAHLSIMGGSNGGLLVGAAMTQRPDLFGAVVCAVPLLDMLRYHLVGIGKAWIPEYGDPEKEADYAWLKAYSPYHRLKPNVKYPALLMLSADSDDRVDPMHARKFVAQLEELRAVGDPATLIRIESKAGHGGGDLRKKALAEAVDEFSFLMSELMK